MLGLGGGLALGHLHDHRWLRDIEVTAGDDGGVEVEGAFFLMAAVAVVDVAEGVDLGTDAGELGAQMGAADVLLAAIGEIENAARGCVGDEEVGVGRDAAPLFDELGLGGVVGEEGEIGTPRRTKNAEAAVLEGGVLQEVRVGETELAALEHEVVVAADAEDLFCGSFGEPFVDVFEVGAVIAFEVTEVAAVDQEVTGRDRDLAVLAVGVCEDAEGDHEEVAKE